MPTTIYSAKHKRIADKLREAREKSGLSQAEAAKLMTKSQSYISKIESGQLRIEILSLAEFGKIYKRSLNYFLR